MAKHSLGKFTNSIRKVMLESHQYGVAVPGGVDILIHARSAIENHLRSDPSLGVWAVVDVDFVNAFPSFHWDAIDASMDELCPEMAAWSRWCHCRGKNLN